MKKKEYTVDELVDFLKRENKNETIEGQLLKKKLIRELYNKIGIPEEKDFPDIYKTAGCGWKKIQGYTNDILIKDKYRMECFNNMATNWCISRASATKIRIVEEYTRAGWHCTVQSYNVMCGKYVQHPKYKNIWVYFYSSRDCNKYEYIILEDEDE
jgi:hypothetical protein